MADLGISIAGNIIEAIGSKIIIEICDAWGYKSQLTDLKETVLTIQQVLRAADAKQELLNEEQRNYIEKLRDAVYDADDLFDEFLTLAGLEQLKPLSKRGRFFEKVRCFFSSKNQVGQAYRMSREVKKIMKRLDDVAHTHKTFKLDLDYRPIRMRREQTCSYVIAKDIIGREEDKKVILNMLLDSDDDKQDDLFVVSIVGVGGLGKTTVAQLVYDDENVKQEFPTRAWVCVSDEGEEKFDVMKILCKILESVTSQNYDSASSMELIKNQFQHNFGGKKYLLVLDDLWNESREKWLALEKFLRLGDGGSRIVVTTRSKRTAEVIRSRCTKELKSLSYEYSWQLFELMAFEKGHETENYLELVEIGKRVVEKCHGSPLAIRVVGSLLFGQDISKWHLFADIELVEIGKGDNGIMSVLKVSYHNLEPSLKTCFSYCALFPKDFEIRKERLISLWIAQGFIVPLHGGQSIEDAAEEHFAILLHRCFFEELYSRSDVCIKIHDLLHDVAQEVARGEIHTDSKSGNLKDKVRHVRYVGDRCPEISYFGSSKIRSFLCWCNKEMPFVVDKYVEYWMYVRVLDLSNLGMTSLPGSIAKLLHLRYLDMSENRSLKGLPNAITRLHNLETLLVYGCCELSELPKSFCQLVKLRRLDLAECALTCMPSGMTKLTNLKVLPYFVAQSDDELQALKSLTEIKGELFIEIGGNYRRNEGINDKRGGYLKSMKHLKSIQIIFSSLMRTMRMPICNHEYAMETMELPSNLKSVLIDGFIGRTIPSWGRAMDNWAISLPQLVTISFFSMNNLQEIPILSKLLYLKELHLEYMDELEYIESNNSTCSAESQTFFPSLRILPLFDMKKLKGWWKRDDDDQRFKFPCLSDLSTSRCPNLKAFPPCPSLEKLKLGNNNGGLQILVKSTGKEEEDIVRLQDVEIDDVRYLKSLPTNCLTHLRIL